MKEDKVYLGHIWDEVKFLFDNSTNVEFSDFINNGIMVRAFERSLEIIGEASKNLSLKFRDNHSYLDWKEMAGLRDKLVHYYFGIDYEKIWDIVRNHIPHLKNKLEIIINEEYPDIQINLF